MTNCSQIKRNIGLVLTAGLLSSCMMGYENNYVGYESYTYGDMPYYQQSYDGSLGYYGNERPVVVPDTYHVGPARSPISAKDGDKNWVSSQNSNGYTIEIANDEQPANVAGKLYQLPKTDHQAEVKYQENGKSYYKGLYGSYSSKEEAQKALDALPANVKQGASISSWGNVQSKVAPE